jgi:hypothetical protein
VICFARLPARRNLSMIHPVERNGGGRFPAVWALDRAAFSL